jgi:hypothetical protein
MTTTAHRRVRPAPGADRTAPAGERVLDAGVRAEVRAVVGTLVDSARAEAQEAGRQLRCLYRLWLLAWEDREIDWISSAEAEAVPVQADERACSLLETEDQLLLDVAAEIGPALNLPAATALDRVREAVVLGLHLPEVLEALEQGRCGARHAAVIADQWRELVEDPASGEEAPPEAVRGLVAELTERAPHCTVAQLRAVARRRRAVLLAETQERRHRRALGQRRVWVEPGEDGTACLHAVLDAPTALAVRERLDALVDRLRPAEELRAAEELAASKRVAWERRAGARRTDDQLRADVLADLLLDGELPDDPGFPRGVRGQVSITVPVLTLLAPSGAAGTGPGTNGRTVRTDAPILSGYGPIDRETAEQLAAGATAWHRVLTHPVTGVVLDHDRTVYAVPAGLRRRLLLRDGTCRFPGCRRRAERCDLDHTVAWQDGGRTAADNLAHLCRHHHLVKHRDGALGRWRVRQLGPSPGGGVLEWTSPGGRTYRTVPEGALLEGAQPDGVAPDQAGPDQAGPEGATAEWAAPEWAAAVMAFSPGAVPGSPPSGSADPPIDRATAPDPPPF